MTALISTADQYTVYLNKIKQLDYSQIENVHSLAVGEIIILFFLFIFMGLQPLCTD